MTTGKDPAKGSRRPNLNGFADQFGMTNFRSEETRRHDGMAEVEGSKWSTYHDNPFGPTTPVQKSGSQPFPRQENVSQRAINGWC